MTHIGRSDQGQIADIACVGSVAADLLMVGVASAPVAGATALASGRLLHPGGGALNTAIAAAKLGLSAAVFGRVGDDLFGQYIKSELINAGVLVGGLVQSPSPTGVSVVLTSSVERSFIYHPGCNVEFCIGDVDLGILGKSRCVHFSDPFELPNFIRNAPQLLPRLVREGCVLSMDACWDPADTWLPAIHDCLPYLDLFFCNRAESERLTHGPLPEDAARFLIGDCGVKRAVVIKLDRDGCLVCSTDRIFRIPAFRATLSDPTGAGDCFTAAFLLGLLKGWSHERSALLANAAGAFAVSEFGVSSGMPSLEELLAFAGSPADVANEDLG